MTRRRFPHEGDPIDLGTLNNRRTRDLIAIDKIENTRAQADSIDLFGDEFHRQRHEL